MKLLYFKEGVEQLCSHTLRHYMHQNDEVFYFTLTHEMVYKIKTPKLEVENNFIYASAPLRSQPMSLLQLDTEVRHFAGVYTGHLLCIPNYKDLESWEDAVIVTGKTFAYLHVEMLGTSSSYAQVRQKGTDNLLILQAKEYGHTWACFVDEKKKKEGEKNEDKTK